MDYESLDCYLRMLRPEEEKHKIHGQAGTLAMSKKIPHAVADYSNLPTEQVHGIKIPVLSKDTFGEFSKDNTFMVYLHPRFTEVPLHMHQWIEMTYVYSGKCTQQIDENLHVLTQGQICLIDTRTPHAVKVCGTNDILINLLMSREYFTINFLSRFSTDSIISQFIMNAISEKTRKDNYILFLSQQNRHLSVLMKEIMCEYFSTSLNSKDVLDSYLALIFLELIRTKEHELSRTPAAKKSSSLLTVLQYMETHSKDTSLKDTARHFSMNPSYLSTRLKNKTGFTYGELMHKIRIAEAKRLLTSTPLCVTDVARSVGYENISFFYQIFQTETGCSPGNYRKQFPF